MDCPIKVVFEDNDLLAVDKPCGILVEGIQSGENTLSNKAGGYIGGIARPLHRLDRDTSGLVLFAKTSRWNRALTEMFEKKRIRKEYWAIVQGGWDRRINKVETRIRPIGEGRWENSRKLGRTAKTTFRVLGENGSQSWIQALPKTGRTHQIRLHCLEVGCPIVGDRFYSSDDQNPLLLHAHSLTFSHPAGSGEVRISVDPPAFWTKWLSTINTPK